MGVGNVATEAASAAFRRAGFPDASLLLHWREIAGHEVARVSRPMKFQETPTGGLLTLVCEPGAALFLGHDARALTGRINAYLGRPVIARVKFTQRTLLAEAPPPPPVSPPGPPPGPDDPLYRYRGPEPLKAALDRLARWQRRR